MGGIVSSVVDIVGKPFGVGGKAAASEARQAEARAREALSGGYRATEARLEPISEMAIPTLEKLQSLITGEGDYDFTTAPGYDFRVGEGLKAIERAAAAGGALQSGGTLRALQERGQQLATEEFQNQINRLSGLYGLTEPYYGAFAELPVAKATKIAPSLRRTGEIQAAEALRGGQQISSGLTSLATGPFGNLSGFQYGIGGIGGIPYGGFGGGSI